MIKFLWKLFYAFDDIRTSIKRRKSFICVDATTGKTKAFFIVLIGPPNWGKRRWFTYNTSWPINSGL